METQINKDIVVCFIALLGVPAFSAEAALPPHKGGTKPLPGEQRNSVAQAAH